MPAKSSTNKKAGTKAPSAAAAADPAATEAAPPETFFESLSPEEQEKEKERQERRLKKAQNEQQKQAYEKWRREEEEKKWAASARKTQKEEQKAEKYTKNLRRRAAAEGVIESQDWDDGKWWVELPGSKGTWKEVPDVLWCSLCDASLNDSVLESHLEGEKHRKKLSWADPAAAAAHPSSAGAAHASSSSGAAGPGASWGVGGGGGVLEEWQTMMTDGSIKCNLCDKLCDGCHELSDAHKRKIADYEWNKKSATMDYAPPVQEFLAWVHEPSFGDGKYLKCLLCDKWVQDFETPANFCTRGYNGNHGSFSDYNQKDHKRKLANYSYYKSDVMTQRMKFHPEPTRRGPSAPQPSGYAAAPGQAKAPTAAPWAKASASAAASAAAPAAKAAGKGMPSSQPSPVPGAPGWWQAWSADDGKPFYYTEGGARQWEPPSSSQAVGNSEAAEEEC